jgi:hypothetical protein
MTPSLPHLSKLQKQIASFSILHNRVQELNQDENSGIEQALCVLDKFCSFYDTNLFASIVTTEVYDSSECWLGLLHRNHLPAEYVDMQRFLYTEHVTANWKFSHIMGYFEEITVMVTIYCNVNLSYYVIYGMQSACV